MPTPESAAFLAKKPTVPPTFDGVDFEDNAAVKNARDAIIREQWVRSMMARLVREELGKCYFREGVNHLEKCGKLRGEFIINSGGVSKREVIMRLMGSCIDRYFELLKEAKIKGYLFEQQNYIPKDS
jgi:hypothetical protein